LNTIIRLQFPNIHVIRTQIRPSSVAYFLELLVSLTKCIAFLLQVVGLHFVMP